jgi:dephospho-CoA kinase
MLKIGITGGIGSGKTTVCHIFELLGVKVYNADIRAKLLLNENAEVKLQVINAFGEKIYPDGILDKKKLAAIVFNDKKALELLNSIVHPAVDKDFVKWVKNHSGEKYILKEAALLFESGTYKSLDFIVAVTAPLELRIKRIIKRDNFTRKQVFDRINNQMNQQDKIRLSDFVIINNERKMLIPQVLKLNRILENISKV